MHKPVIEPNYFAHREDINVLIEGIRIACNISEQPAMKRFGSRLHRIPFPGCRHLPFDSDEYWECSIRQVCSTNTISIKLTLFFFNYVSFYQISSHLQSTIPLEPQRWDQVMTMVR